MKKALNVFYHFEPLYRLSKLYKLEQKHFRNGMLKIADEVLDEQEKLRSKLSSQSSDIYDDGHSKRPKNFIDTLLDAKDRLDEDDMKDEINSTIAAVSCEVSSMKFQLNTNSKSPGP